jgi:hypothetical protein
MSTRSNPTDKSTPTERQSTKTHPDVYREVDQDSNEAAYRERAPMKSTGRSPKRTSNDDYRVKQHLRVNATYRWQLTQIFHEALHEGSGERRLA